MTRRAPRLTRPTAWAATVLVAGAAALLLVACGSTAPGGAATTAPTATRRAAPRRAAPARTRIAPAPETPSAGAASSATATAAASTTGSAATATPAPVETPAPTAAPTAASTPAPTATSAPAATPAPTTAAVLSDTAPFTSSDNTWTDAVNQTAIPIGDGHVSTSARAGYVDSCTTSFRGGGAQHDGPWVNAANGTWNLTTKISVLGSHLWPNAYFRASVQGATRVISVDAVPVGLPTGTYPIARNDPAYQYDPNPNAIAAQSLTYSLPANPSAATPSCTHLGVIGVTTAGVVLFNALDDAGRDAGAHEVQDSCHGHPNGRELYHYHSISSCLEHPQPNTSMLVGYAIDGYGIYAEWNASGHLPTNADLDACHGRTSSIVWKGKRVTMYHYDVTLEYPYTIGCFHGTPIQTGPPNP